MKVGPVQVWSAGCYDVSVVSEGDLEGSATPGDALLLTLQSLGLTGGDLHNSSLLLEKAGGIRSNSEPGDVLTWMVFRFFQLDLIDSGCYLLQRR